MQNKYLEKLAFMLNPAKSLSQVANQARRIEGKAVRQQLSARISGGSPARMQQLGQRRTMAGTVRINADQMATRLGMNKTVK